MSLCLTHYFSFDIKNRKPQKISKTIYIQDNYVHKVSANIYHLGGIFYLDGWKATAILYQDDKDNRIILNKEISVNPRNSFSTIEFMIPELEDKGLWHITLYFEKEDKRIVGLSTIDFMIEDIGKFFPN